MRPFVFVISVFFASFLLLGAVATGIAFASQPNQGYVQYSVSLSGQTGSQPKVFTINESSSGTSQKGFVDLGLAVSSSNTNLSFSRILNASSLPEIFPYLPGLNNESFSFQSHGVAISISFLNTGTSSATFNGKSYQLSDYKVDISASNSSNGELMTLGGNVASMPSGLVYSAHLNLNSTYTADVQLLSTNLPLVVSSGNSSSIGAVMVGAGVFGAFALAVPAVFKKVRSNRSIQIKSKDVPKEKEGNGKPEYWVD